MYDSLTHNSTVKSLLNQAGLSGLTFCGVQCRAVETGNPLSDWRVVEPPTEHEMNIQYIASAYPSVEAANDALRELIAREPIDPPARKEYWAAMNETAEVIFEFLGLM